MIQLVAQAFRVRKHPVATAMIMLFQMPRYTVATTRLSTSRSLRLDSNFPRRTTPPHHTRIRQIAKTFFQARKWSVDRHLPPLLRVSDRFSSLIFDAIALHFPLLVIKSVTRYTDFAFQIIICDARLEC